MNPVMAFETDHAEAGDKHQETANPAIEMVQGPEVPENIRFALLAVVVFIQELIPDNHILLVAFGFSVGSHRLPKMASKSDDGGKWLEP